MKLRALLALALVATAALSGCFGSDDEPTDDHCADGHADADCPGNELAGTGNETAENETVIPNIPPTVALGVFDDAGNETRSTMLGGNLTFDASQSVDSDGAVDQAAITIVDSNQTRTASLFSNGAFTPATFMFDRPGVVNVTLSVIDDAGDIVSLLTQVFVNHPQNGKGHTFTVFDPYSSATDCAGPIADPVGGPTNPFVWKGVKFDILDGATYATAQVASGAAKIAFCDPDGNPISDEGTDMITTSSDANLTKSITYFVSVVAQPLAPAPNTGSPADSRYNNPVSLDIIVYYDARPVE